MKRLDCGMPLIALAIAGCMLIVLNIAPCQRRVNRAGVEGYGFGFPLEAYTQEVVGGMSGDMQGSPNEVWSSMAIYVDILLILFLPLFSYLSARWIQFRTLSNGKLSAITKLVTLASAFVIFLAWGLSHSFSKEIGLDSVYYCSPPTRAFGWPQPIVLYQIGSTRSIWVIRKLPFDIAVTMAVLGVVLLLTEIIVTYFEKSSIPKIQ